MRILVRCISSRIAHHPPGHPNSCFPAQDQPQLDPAALPLLPVCHFGEMIPPAQKVLRGEVNRWRSGRGRGRLSEDRANDPSRMNSNRSVQFLVEDNGYVSRFKCHWNLTLMNRGLARRVYLHEPGIWFTDLHPHHFSQISGLHTSSTWSQRARSRAHTWKSL